MTLEGLHEDLRDLLVLFADADVDFVIVGARVGLSRRSSRER